MASDPHCREFLERNRAGVFRQTLDGRLIDCNAAFASILGFATPNDLLKRGSIDFTNQSDWAMIVAALDGVESLRNLEVSLRKSDGNAAWVLANVSRVVVMDGVPAIEGIILDLSEQRLASETFEHQTQHDPITGLPNRALFVDRLSVAIARARRQRGSVAVLYIDIDRFAELNASYGPGVANRILKGIGSRLTEALRLEDSVARYASDEFTFLLAEFGEDENTALIAERIQESIARPFAIEGELINVSASTGIAIYPEDGEDPDTLLQHAGAAMHRAKELGRNTYQLYEPALNERAFERLFLVANLRRAFERGEFSLHYQPEIDVLTGTIRCIEALLRWNHPDIGVVEPPEFLLAAEDAKLVVPLGDWVLREACRQANQWHDAGLKDLRVAVNLSGRQFREPDLRDRVENALVESGMDPRLMELEIAEPLLGNGSRFALAALKDLGIKIALDDFGLGGASFNDLRQMPVDTLKIDPSFIRDVAERRDDAAIVDGIITMARGMNLRIVAEGVETMEQMTFLRDHRCTEMQGYFFGRPIPALELEETLGMQTH
ncbi:MAG TPA: EAL domain-containing protein [Thermoanaerobaculia bacterium]